MKSTSTRPRGRTWLVPALVITALAVVVLLVFSMSGPSSAGNSSAGTSAAGNAADDGREQAEPPNFSFAERHDPDDPLATGSEQAPVTLIVFSDYQCPFCAQWSEQTLPTLMEYVDAGDLRIEWRDLSVFGPASEQAALAAYAAALQGAYLEYHDALFPEGNTRGDGGLSADALVQLAGELNLDAEQFEVDMNSPETATAVAANVQLANDLGAYSTPVFLLAGEPIVGAQPTEVFVTALDEAIAEAKG